MIQIVIWIVGAIVVVSGIVALVRGKGGERKKRKAEIPPPVTIAIGVAIIVFGFFAYPIVNALM